MMGADYNWSGTRRNSLFPLITDSWADYWPIAVLASCSLHRVYRLLIFAYSKLLNILVWKFKYFNIYLHYSLNIIFSSFIFIVIWALFLHFHVHYSSNPISAPNLYYPKTLYMYFHFHFSSPLKIIKYHHNFIFYIEFN